MNHKRILHTLFFTPGLDGRWGLTMLFDSPPGAAKTAVIRAACHAAGLPLEVLSPGERGEGAFGVTPVPEQQMVGVSGSTHRTLMTYPPPDWTERMPKRGVVFIDEMGSTPPALQAPLLGLLHGGVIGSYRLPPGVRTIGAKNPVEMAAGGFDLAMSVANRVGHMAWEPFSATEWGEFLMSMTGSGMERGRGEVPTDQPEFDPTVAEKEEERVLALWAKPWARIRATVAGFVKRNPEALYKIPSASDVNASKAFPTLRTWEMAARALAGCEVHGLSGDDATAVFSAFIGEAPASEFLEWQQNLDLPDPELVVDGKLQWTPDSRRLDITETVLTAVVAMVLGSKGNQRKERADNVWKILRTLTDTDALDVAYPHAEKLVVNGLHGKEARDVLRKLEPIMREAGLIREGK